MVKEATTGVMKGGQAMFAESDRLKWLVALLPAFGLLCLDLWFVAVPKYQKLQTVRTTERDHTRSITKLNEEVEQLSGWQTHRSADESRLVHLTKDQSETPVPQSVLTGRPSFVQTLSDILESLEHHGVRCVAANTKSNSPKPDHADQSTGTLREHLLLIGDYQNVLAAMREIEATVPHTLTTSLTMQRESLGEPPRWRMTFAFRGDSR